MGIQQREKVCIPPGFVALVSQICAIFWFFLSKMALGLLPKPLKVEVDY